MSFAQFSNCATVEHVFYPLPYRPAMTAGTRSGCRPSSRSSSPSISSAITASLPDFNICPGDREQPPDRRESLPWVLNAANVALDLAYLLAPVLRGLRRRAGLLMGSIIEQLFYCDTQNLSDF